MPRVGFTGTRSGMTPHQLGAFARFASELFRVEDEDEWHDGDCIGADDQAHKMVAQMHATLVRAGHPGIKMIGHPGNLPSYYASNVFDETREIKVNIDRNHDIVDAVEVLIACPGETVEQLRSGTWATIRYAKKRKEAGANLVLILIYPDGSWEKV